MKIAKLDIGERTTSFSLRIIRLYRALSKDEVGRVLGRQMRRSGTSIGANVYEAQGAQSRKDLFANVYCPKRSSWKPSTGFV
jgi:four helix bundle protein